MKMYKNGFTAEQIASATDKDIEEVKAIIAGKEPAHCIRKFLMKMRSL